VHTLWSIDSEENEQNWCHQMSDLKAKMHQIWLISVGASPQTPLGKLISLPQIH